MAAGMSTRFAPLSYEKPKALLKVRGELLIEREIEQLKSAGINDITVVVGYMKEKLFYLEDKYDVNIVVNEDYYRFNNTSTLMPVIDKLDNTYICSSDNYFTQNPFEQYVYHAYYAAAYSAGETDEYCITANKKNRITDVTIGGRASWYMIGHVYFDRNFSREFASILSREYSNPVVQTHLWEDLYISHIDMLDMDIRRYENGIIYEFDSLDELRDFDPDYLSNTDSQIFVNICNTLGCASSDIHGIYPIKSGMTNMSFYFKVGDKEYVYRHPGIGTSNYINRKCEALATEISRELGLDETFIHMDAEEGWKLSYFLDDCKTLDYHDKKQVSQAIDILKKLHTSGRTVPYDIDIWQKIEDFLVQLEHNDRTDFEDMSSLMAMVDELKFFLNQDTSPHCLCHCDSYDPNFLIDKSGKMHLIDWEYAGMADPACDIGTFVACSDYSMTEADEIIALYLGHEPFETELRHYLAYIAVLSYYWFLWALYQESIGKTVGKYLYIWYRYTKSYGERALKMYREEI
jgi:CTP:phosphocholine cytidylyltransferase-like protein/thiamine kinase-like enzyme